MQHKGFVTVFAVLLTIVCLFYLSFNVVVSHYDKQAVEYAKGNKMAEYQYLDSLANDTVFLNYTLKECRENGVNLGLDLKGGMNVILEVSVPDIVRTLSGDSKDENFNKALEAAQQRQSSDSRDFVDLFVEEYEKLDPNAQLATIFFNYEMKDQLTVKSTNKEVADVLKKEVEAAVGNSFNVLRSRIDRFGVVQPNIQALETNGRILIELPGVKEPERVRKLLQGSANLEFWETYNGNELAMNFNRAEEVLRGIYSEDLPIAEAPAEDAAEEVAETEETPLSSLDSLTAAVQNAEQPESTEVSPEDEARFRAEHPLLSRMQLFNAETAVIAYVSARDTAKVTEMLNLRQVQEVFPRDVKFRWAVKPVSETSNVYELFALRVTNRDGKAPLSGNAITDASDELSQFSASSKVNMTMNPEGAKIWARLTKENIGRSIAVVMDDMVYSCPRVNSEIPGGRSEITGNFTTQEAKDLANVLKSGKMPARSRIVQEDVVGPSLGQEAIQKGMVSFIVAFVLLMIYMIFMYGLIPGLIVDASLLFNVFFLVGILASFKSVLTLPGIAGIVLTLGMAVDANVLVYERVKEELLGGKSHKAALKAGYQNALSAIIDGNLTTLITGIILFVFGTGPIRGFATTLIIGIMTTLFSALLLTRLIYGFMEKGKTIDTLAFSTPMSKNLLKNVNIDWMRIRKFGYIISACFILVAIGSLATRHLNLGIDFSGGRNYVVRFDDKVSTADIADKLQPGFGDASVSVITIGTENQVRISTNYKIDDRSESVDSEVEEIIFTALQPLLHGGVTQDMFVRGYVVKDGVAQVAVGDEGNILGIQSSQKVGPAIANDIITKAMWAVLFAMIAIFLYILIRFRNLGYSVGSLVALVHDVLFTLGLFSLFYSIMPFSMEIDQAFIAAILTIVGYSVNDTVVVFDRVRETTHLYAKRPLDETINDALNATLARTLSTSLSTLIVLLAILILGGDTIRGFVFALTVGVIVGTYSTLFVAVPIAYDIRKKQIAKGK
ncbi:MAG: protein translocase subunit SecDF [Paludibacteraceae bacterium]|nr:protein translocase subunit SecDF [Paludibacteraceae bacterium]